MLGKSRKKQTRLNHYFGKVVKEELPQAPLQELPNQVQPEQHVELMSLDTEE